ncbi:spore germination protein [Ruminiclostridium cellobioparum]|uniref:spore germination protein n=1 Tax=Ruminiclostridium cellobioparum TaxID=29355 RepID=UPI000A006C92|nr:spore germination protein [Ruminiclostridium cellobioparum]
MLVIIVSVTALGSFAIPNYSMGLAIRIERFFFIIAGAFLGFFGIAFVIFTLGCITCSMKSFGIPFLTPVAPKTKANPDVVLRTPIWMQDKRPDPFQTANRQKQGKNVKNWALKEEPKQKDDNSNGNK